MRAAYINLRTLSRVQKLFFLNAVEYATNITINSLRFEKIYSQRKCENRRDNFAENLPVLEIIINLHAFKFRLFIFKNIKNTIAV